MRNKLLNGAILLMGHGQHGPNIVRNFMNNGISFRRAKRAVKRAEEFRAFAKHITYLDRYGSSVPITKVRVNSPNIVHSMNYQELELRALATFYKQFKVIRYA